MRDVPGPYGLYTNQGSSTFNGAQGTEPHISAIQYQIAEKYFEVE